MQTLTELISDDPAWPLVQTWITEARTQVLVLPAERSRSERVLHLLQVTTRSPLGAVASETAGITVGGGWLRFLGGGGGGLEADLARWNGLDGPCPLKPTPKGLLVIAHDVLSGFFALDGGGLGDGKHSVFYFARARPR